MIIKISELDIDVLRSMDSGIMAFLEGRKIEGSAWRPATTDEYDAYCEDMTWTNYMNEDIEEGVFVKIEDGC
jgi:hypothetical protein